MMYIPKRFAEPETPELHRFIDAHPFATLVTGNDGLYATHLPLVLRADDGPFGTLEGHVARANPHQARIGIDTAALVIFAGEQTHITPTWYPSKLTDARVVPTWNYVAVHAYGTVNRIEDAAFLHAHVERLTVRHEAARGSEWRTDDPPADYVAQQLKAIVGVEVRIALLEGKWKMSQNRSEADVDGVIEGLRRAGEHDVAEVVSGRKQR